MSQPSPSNTDLSTNMFTCPISLTIMKDPVIAADGHTYEREEIVKWINLYHTSPLTRIALKVEQLLPNYAVKSAIAMMKQNEIQEKEKEKEKIEDVSSYELIPKSPLFKIEKLVTNNKTILNVLPPEKGNRIPCSFICVLDISGSMQLEATENNNNNEKSKINLSRLDLVKHSIKTIIGNLNQDDTLSIITFSNVAQILFPLQKMTTINKLDAISKLEKTEADGMTNLWDGIRTGINAAENPLCNNTNTIVLVFTDGEPTPESAPPRGLWPSLQTLLAKSSRATVHTFGFGFKLESKLLSDIANAGHGVFAYLPDASIVGTVFVNFVSYVLSTLTTSCLYIQNGNDIETKKCIGTLQYGQKRSILCDYSDPKVFYEDQEIEISSIANSDSKDFSYDMLRFEFIEILRKLLNNNKVTKDDLTLVENSLKLLFDSYDNSITKINNLFRDIVSENENESQISKALSRLDWYNKWGKHYLFAVISAHSLEYRCNFKDPGVQNYGGKLFDEFQAAADELFCKMPAPRPAVQQQNYDNYSGYSYGGNYYNGPASGSADDSDSDYDMSSFMDRNGPCFSGNALVLMKDGSRKLVSEICKGDETLNGIVECIIRTSVNLPKLVEIDGFFISPYHPIQSDNKWVFPITLGTAIPRDVTYIYDFILDSRKHLDLNGTVVATWAHGSTEEVLNHPFYGTEVVVDRLKQHKDWNCGFIELIQSCANSRDENRLVNTLIF